MVSDILDTTNEDPDEDVQIEGNVQPEGNAEPIFNNIINAITTVSKMPNGHYSIIGLLISGLHLKVVRAFMHPIKLPDHINIEKLLDILEQLPSNKLVEASSHIQTTGTTGVLLYLAQVVESGECEVTQSVTLAELIGKEGMKKDLASEQAAVTGFQDTNLTERDVDIHFLKPFFDNLLTEIALKSVTRESHRPQDISKQLIVAQSYSISPDDVCGLELGMAENSGPQQQELMDKARFEFVKASKGGCDQLAQFQKLEGKESISYKLEDDNLNILS
ncbi:7007_t:CDS:2 [Paraglomus brasilianum]|uniref:7007_t:CDS:1 n=1 Tax=Paraglomus brasilianum TaxID=144538 RepID=A0A9N8Z1D6_9GLOM|nr:7007_t:CDS:2 [Paraglomus brasilianum]